MKKYILATLLITLTINCLAQVTVPIRGNTYVTSNDKKGVLISRGGMIEQWTSPSAQISTYFKLSTAGSLDISIKARNSGQPSKIKATVAGKTFNIDLTSSQSQNISLGNVEILDSGYVQVILEGVSKTGDTYGIVEGYVISGTATKKGVAECGKFNSYWANRGPSVHMSYQLPTTSKTEYFYNEVTVRPGNDVIGSYYMACGFGQGYFGMQVNSATERRILFSVWSPFETQDPKSIPDSLQIKMIERGEGVHVGEFGNEGSGGQSYLRYNWITGNTYKFLMQVRPDGKGNSLYTARFYAPETGKWQLIATFLRPSTDTYYTHPYSFLENFSPAQGFITREVEFSNQWARSSEGVWSEVTNAYFTYDATAQAGARKDYQGGVKDNNFYLKNCGFFNQNTPYKAEFQRKPTNIKPVIE